MVEESVNLLTQEEMMISKKKKLFPKWEKNIPVK